MNQTQTQEESTSITGSSRYMTLIYSNDHTPQDVVVMVIMRATGCTTEEAYIEMWEAEHYGKAPVHFANEEECQKVADIIESVGVATSVLPEWND